VVANAAVSVKNAGVVCGIRRNAPFCGGFGAIFAFCLEAYYNVSLIKSHPAEDGRMIWALRPFFFASAGWPYREILQEKRASD
jgi:hypothetical protein